MTERTKRLALAVVLTVVDLAASSYYCGVIWQAFARDRSARATLLGGLCLWIAMAVVMWLHVVHDMCEVIRKRNDRLALGPATAPDALRRDSDV
jgi:hypothetical protein